MQKNKITAESIVTIANQIKELGEKPNISNVSEALGVYGHTGVIARHLEDWYRNQPEFQRSEYMPVLTEDIDQRETEIRQKNQELNQSLALVRSTLESTFDGILMIDKNGTVVDWNQKFVDMWRLPVGLLEAGPEGPGFAYVLDQVEDPEGLVAQVTKLYDNPNEQGNLGEVRFKDGRIFERYSQPHRVNNEIVGRVWSFRDVTAQRADAEALRLRSRAIEASSNGIVMIDISEHDTRVIYVNPAFERMTGYTDDGILGQNFTILLGSKMNQVGTRSLELAIKEHREEEIVLQSFRKNGEMFWTEMHIAPVTTELGKINHFIIVMSDITQRRKMEEQLIHQATFDQLTNLPNRSLLVDRVQQAIVHAKNYKVVVAVLFLDLDRFKLINDSLGHSVGDELLQLVANRLIKATSDGDTVARIGGDEFVVVLPTLQHEEEALSVAERILTGLNEPLYLNGQQFNITTSMGISFYPKDGNSFGELLKNADLSMYSAKEAGRNTIKIFNQDMDTKIKSRMIIENELHGALERKELSVNYHPIVNLKTGKVICNEALLRWNNPKLGSVSPVEFIPLMEENGMILEVGNWVLETACQQTKLWQDQGFSNLSIAVNLSGTQFKQKTLANMIDAILKKTGLKPEFLMVEITESILLDDLQSTLTFLNLIKDMGVSVSIDDFGTGYSSLAYLKQFPVDELKIDRSFINDLVKNENDRAIVNAILGLAKSLMLKVVAEGVETKQQLDYLIANECEEAQGFYFTKPGLPDVIEKLFSKDLIK